MTAAETLLERIEHRMLILGLNDNQLSQAVAGNGYVMRDIRRGTMPRGARLLKIAQILGTSAEWLMGAGDPPPDPPAPGHERIGGVHAPIRDFRPQQLPRDLPVLGAVLGSPYGNGGDVPVESHLVDMGDTVDMVRRPAGLASVSDAYALYVTGDSQAPRFKPGELIFVNPRRPPAIGDDVVVQLVDDDGQVVTALIKELVRRTADAVTLRQFNPDTTIIVPVARIRAIHRVTPWAELLGI